MTAILLQFLATGLLLPIASGLFPSNFILQPANRKSRNEINDEIDAQLTTDEETIVTLTGHLDEIQKLIDVGYPMVNADDAETGTGNTNEEGTETGSEVELHEFPVYVNKYKEEFTGGKAERDEMTDRVYIGYIEEKADDISGMCASRVHSGIMYFLNDNSEDNPYIYAVDIEHGITLKSTIKLSVTKDDWEDMACGPCDEDSEDFCIYVIDDRDGNNYLPEIIYKFKEPVDLLEEVFYTGGEIEKIYFNSNFNSIQTLMVDHTGRIFVMDKTSYYYTLYEVNGDGLTELFDVDIWTYYTGPVSGDISADGRGWLFKMYDRVYYFYVPDPSKMKTILSDRDNREKMPYHEEAYGTSVAWTHEMGSFLTVSEGSNMPWYRYYRLA